MITQHRHHQHYIWLMCCMFQDLITHTARSRRTNSGKTQLIKMSKPLQFRLCMLHISEKNGKCNQISKRMSIFHTPHYNSSMPKWTFLNNWLQFPFILFAFKHNFNIRHLSDITSIENAGRQRHDAIKWAVWLQCQRNKINYMLKLSETDDMLYA